jgi:RNA polymerase sigma factor (TIGR02999 family)
MSDQSRLGRRVLRWVGLAPVCSLGSRRVDSPVMTDVTHLLDAAAAGDPTAGAELLPLVYDELRQLAAARMAAESPGHTLQATALVHEAYLRLVGGERPQEWNGRGHFFAAAAEAMRRILVEAARRKGRAKHGGDLNRVDLDAAQPAAGPQPDEVIQIDEAVSQLAAHDPLAARLVSLRYFAGLTVDEAAAAAGVPRSTAYEHWAYAKAWIHRAVRGVS